MVSREQDELRLLLMGCGSVGGVIAGRWIKAGYDVTIVTHNETITQAIRTQGLKLITPDETLTVPATAHTQVMSVEGPFDAVCLR